MSNPINSSHSRPASFQLMRKQRLLEKIPFSKSTLHAKLNPKSPYFDETFPRPIYFPSSRIPYWDEGIVNQWIASNLVNHSSEQKINRAAKLKRCDCGRGAI